MFLNIERCIYGALQLGQTRFLHCITSHSKWLFRWWTA